MKLQKLNLLLILFISHFFCYSQSIINEKQMLITCLKSEKFEEFYKIYKGKTDTIYVYNNIEKINNITYITAQCNQVFKIIKSNIKIDVNTSNNNRENKIVLYDYKFVNNRYEFFFIDLGSNQNLVFTLNKKNKIISFRSGSF